MKILNESFICHFLGTKLYINTIIMVLDDNLGNGSVLSKEFHFISEFSIIGVATPKGCHEVLWALLKPLTRHRMDCQTPTLH